MGKFKNPEMDAFFSKSFEERFAEAKRRAEEFRGNANRVFNLIERWEVWQESMRRADELTGHEPPVEIKQAFLAGKRAYEHYADLVCAASEQDLLAFRAATAWLSREPPKAQ